MSPIHSYREDNSPETGDLRRSKKTFSKPSAEEQHEKLMSLAKKRPVQALQRAQNTLKSFREGFRFRTYRMVAVAMRAAAALKQESEDYVTFTEHPFWMSKVRRPKGNEAGEDVLRWCLIFVFEATSTAEMKRIYVYYKTLGPLLDTGIDPEVIPEKLKQKGGFEGLGDSGLPEGIENSDDSDDAAAHPVRGTGTSVIRPDLSEGARGNDGPDEPNPEGGSAPEGGLPAAPKRATGAEEDVRADQNEGLEKLYIWATHEDIAWACNLAEGAEVKIKFKREGKDGTRVRFVFLRHINVLSLPKPR